MSRTARWYLTRLQDPSRPHSQAKCRFPLARSSNQSWSLPRFKQLLTSGRVAAVLSSNQETCSKACFPTTKLPVATQMTTTYVELSTRTPRASTLQQLWTTSPRVSSFRVIDSLEIDSKSKSRATGMTQMSRSHITHYQQRSSTHMNNYYSGSTAAKWN